MGRINSYTNVTRADKNDEILIDGAAGTRNMALGDLAVGLGGMISKVMNRNIWRGKHLGSSLTDAQKKAIANGTFDDLFIGDYWNINNVIYQIVDMNYWYNTGDNPCSKNHLVIMPTTVLYNHEMNDNNTTTGGYVGSKMYLEGLNQAKDMINSAFGEANILNHREYLTTEVTNEHPSKAEWRDSTIELPNEIMMYGCPIYTTTNDGVKLPMVYTIDKQQLAATKLYPKVTNIRSTYWLRDVVSSSFFASVYSTGVGNYIGASLARGVRPVFGLTGGD